MRRIQLLSLSFLAAACGGGEAADASSSGTTESGSSGGGTTGAGSTTAGSGGTGGSGMATTTGTTTGGSTTGFMPVCGNAAAEDGEECDDGNDVMGDGCNPDCSIGTDTRDWERTHDGGQMGTDIGHGVAVDDQGNVYVAGYTFEDVSLADAWLRKYDPDGTELWTVTHAGMATGGDDRAFAVAVTADGGAVVAGVVQDLTSDSDVWVQAWDPSGMPGWGTTYAGAAGGDDFGYGVAVGPNGEVAVVGMEKTATDNDALVLVYDAGGVLAWSEVTDGPASTNDQAHGVAFDSAGNVVIAGWLSDPMEAEDAWVWKYDPSGTELWTQVYADAAHSSDRYWAVTVDAMDRVVAAGGYTKGTAGENIIVRMWDADGALLWTDFYNGPASKFDRAGGVAVDHDGNIIVAGFKGLADATTDAWVRKYDAVQLQVWTQSFDGPGSGNDEAHAVATDAAGNVFVVGELRGTGGTSDIWLAKLLP